MQDILQRLPHRPPFVMIDSIAATEAGAVAQYRIPQDNVLLRDGLFSESGLIENMAQAAGAGLPRPTDGSAPSLGYIGAIKDLHIEKLPRAGETITTTVRYLNQVMNVHLAHADVRNEAGECLASCELKIFLQPS
jgi:predicted hotdog family 3-hydroxylacyl-ACP dehydratase